MIADHAFGMADVDAPSLLLLAPSLWLDAADTATVTVASGGVDHWADKSGHGRHHAPSNPAARPVYTNAMNGLPVITFDANANDLSWGEAGVTTMDWREVFAVAHVTHGIAGGIFENDYGLFTGLDWAPVNSGLGLACISNSSNICYYGWYDAQYLNGEATATIVGLPTMASPFLINGRASIATNTSGSRIGNDRIYGYLNRGWPGHLAELIAFPALLSTEDRAAVVSYLKTKWGIA